VFRKKAILWKLSIALPSVNILNDEEAKSIMRAIRDLR
jgi:hypothetical protein